MALFRSLDLTDQYLLNNYVNNCKTVIVSLRYVASSTRAALANGVYKGMNSIFCCGFNTSCIPSIHAHVRFYSVQNHRNPCYVRLCELCWIIKKPSTHYMLVALSVYQLTMKEILVLPSISLSFSPLLSPSLSLTMEVRMNSSGRNIFRRGFLGGAKVYVFIWSTVTEDAVESKLLKVSLS